MVSLSPHPKPSCNFLLQDKYFGSFSPSHEENRNFFLYFPPQLNWLTFTPLFLISYFVSNFYQSQLTILMGQFSSPFLPWVPSDLLWGWNLRWVLCCLVEERQLGVYHWVRIFPFPCEFSVPLSPLQWSRSRGESTGWCQQWYKHIIVMVRSGCLPFCTEETSVVSKRPCSSHCVSIAGSISTGRKKTWIVGLFNSFKLPLMCVSSRGGQNHSRICKIVPMNSSDFFAYYLKPT